MAEGVSSQITFPAPGSGCRHARFQRLADLRKRVASGASCLRHLRSPRRARSGDSLGKRDRRDRFAHGARERQHADGRSPAPGRGTLVSRARPDYRLARYIGSEPSHEKKHQEDDEDDSDDTHATVAIAVTVAAESATEATEKKDHEEDTED